MHRIECHGAAMLELCGACGFLYKNAAGYRAHTKTDGHKRVVNQALNVVDELEERLDDSYIIKVFAKRGDVKRISSVPVPAFIMQARRTNPTAFK